MWAAYSPDGCYKSTYFCQVKVLMRNGAINRNKFGIEKEDTAY